MITGTISGYVNMSSFVENFGQVDKAKGIAFSSRQKAGIIFLFEPVLADYLAESSPRDMEGDPALFLLHPHIRSQSGTNNCQNCVVSILIRRIIRGLSNGALAVLIPMAQAVTAPPHLRGTLVSSL